MATKSRHYGSILRYSTNDSSYTDLTDVKSVSPPKNKRGDAEITVLDSTSFAREFMASWINGGEVTFMVYLHKTQIATLQTMFDAGTTYYWRCVLPLLSGESTSSYVKWQGYLNGLEVGEVSTEDQGIYMVTFSQKVTGVVSWTSGS